MGTLNHRTGAASRWPSPRKTKDAPRVHTAPVEVNAGETPAPVEDRSPKRMRTPR
jgi:hypothetical protein